MNFFQDQFKKNEKLLSIMCHRKVENIGFCWYESFNYIYLEQYFTDCFEIGYKTVHLKLCFIQWNTFLYILISVLSLVTRVIFYKNLYIGWQQKQKWMVLLRLLYLRFWMGAWGSQETPFPLLAHIGETLCTQFVSLTLMLASSLPGRFALQTYQSTLRDELLQKFSDTLDFIDIL